MARHTTCTTVAGIWDGVPGFSFVAGAIGGISLIIAGVIITLGAFSAAGITPQSMIIASMLLMIACLFGIYTVTKVRDYIFDHRLICLGADTCAVAHVITIEANDDGDHSLNTVLAGATYDTPESEYAKMFQPAKLVYVDPGLAAQGFHLDPKANREGHSPQTFGHGNLPFFHCEIEGTRFDELTTEVLAFLYTVLGIAIAALILASIFTALGPLATIVWIAVALLILLLLLLLSLFGLDETGSVGVPNIGNAQPSPTGPVITDVGGGTVSLGDFLALIGRPVCDTGHNPACWDELHSVKGIAKIQEAEYHNVTEPHISGDIYDKYCAALHTYIDGVARLGQALSSDNGGPGNQNVPYLEHPTIG
jgi:hypothetical protein